MTFLICYNPPNAGQSLRTVEGRDYSRASMIIVFPAGSGNGATMCMDIPIANDDFIEGTEYYYVKNLLLLALGPGSVDLGDTLFTISDDEG